MDKSIKKLLKQRVEAEALERQKNPENVAQIPQIRIVPPTSEAISAQQFISQLLSPAPFSNQQIIAQIPSPAYSNQSAMLIEPSVNSAAPSSEGTIGKIFSFMETMNDQLHTIKMQQATGMNAMNVLTHDLNKLQDDVKAMKGKTAKKTTKKETKKETKKPPPQTTNTQGGKKGGRRKVE